MSALNGAQGLLPNAFNGSLLAELRNPSRFRDQTQVFFMQSNIMAYSNNLLEGYTQQWSVDASDSVLTSDLWQCSENIYSACIQTRISWMQGKFIIIYAISGAL